MRKLSKRIVLGLAGAVGVSVACLVAYINSEQNSRSAVKPVVLYTEAAGDGNKRTISHPDGTRSVFIRTENQRTLIKYHYAGNGELSQMTVYRLDEKGKALSAKIFDGGKEELFQVSFGYRKSDGILVEERMFDSKRKHISPDDGKELPVWRVIHTWDENGKPADSTIIKIAPDAEMQQGEIAPFVNPFSI